MQAAWPGMVAASCCAEIPAQASQHSPMHARVPAGNTSRMTAALCSMRKSQLSREIPTLCDFALLPQSSSRRLRESIRHRAQQGSHPSRSQRTVCQRSSVERESMLISLSFSNGAPHHPHSSYPIAKRLQGCTCAREYMVAPKSARDNLPRSSGCWSLMSSSCNIAISDRPSSDYAVSWRTAADGAARTGRPARASEAIVLEESLRLDNRAQLQSQFLDLLSSGFLLRRRLRRLLFPV